jgi:hypothetical protein
MRRICFALMSDYFRYHLMLIHREVDFELGALCEGATGTETEQY